MFKNLSMAVVIAAVSGMASGLGAASNFMAAPAPRFVSRPRGGRHRGAGNPGRAGDKLARMAAEGCIGMRHGA